MNQIKLSLIIAAIGTIFFTSCTREELTDPSNNNTNNTVQQGKWRVTLFNDSGRDETHHFTGYEFTFNSNGTVTAVKGSNVVNGTWITGTDDSKSKLILNFSPASPFDELNEDWRVLELSNSRIRLEHVSGGNGGTDLLTFEKN